MSNLIATKNGTIPTAIRATVNVAYFDHAYWSTDAALAFIEALEQSGHLNDFPEQLRSASDHVLQMHDPSSEYSCLTVGGIELEFRVTPETHNKRNVAVIDLWTFNRN